MPSKRIFRSLVATALVFLLMLALSGLCFSALASEGDGGGAASSSAFNRDQAQQEYNDLQTKVKENREKITQLENSIKAGQATAEQAAAQKNYYVNEAALVEQQVNLKIAEIDHKQSEIDAKILEVAQKQREYDDNYQLAVLRLRAIYKMNNASTLSVLLSVDSFSDLLAVGRSLQAIGQNDAELLDNLEVQRQALEQQQAELEGMLAELEQHKAELDQKRDEYNTAAANAQATYSNAMQQIEMDEAAKDQAAAEMEQFQKEMEELWKALGSSSGQYVGGALCWPVPSHNGDQYISSYYGWRTLYGRPDFHTGIDIARGPTASVNGAAIVAANSGEVILVVRGSNYGYGNYLILDHGGGIRTLYGHCQDIIVNKGDWVDYGKQIATVGNTGNSTGPHLHFEIRINNSEKVNPYPYLTGQKSL